jgi:hypothetical protein
MKFEPSSFGVVELSPKYQIAGLYEVAPDPN